MTNAGRLPFRLQFNRPVHALTVSNSPASHFYSYWLQKERPYVIPRQHFLTPKNLTSHEIRAFRHWIQPRLRDKGPFELNYDYLQQYGDAIVPIEQTTWCGPEQKQVESFERFEAPLSLFLEWTKAKLTEPETFYPNRSLYIAQCDISSLPQPLQDDLPTPLYVDFPKPRPHMSGEKNRKWKDVETDIYGSSIWMGIPPTETPLHKDPHENFFVQLAGTKRVRLMQPDQGDMVLHLVRKACAKMEGGRAAVGGLRGEEMMVGPEREFMDEVVWDAPGLQQTLEEFEKLGVRQHPNIVKEEVNKDEEDEEEVEDAEGESGEDAGAADGVRGELPLNRAYQLDLNAGDALFIPKGWYHSIRGLGDHRNGVNISANWWFRRRFAEETSPKQKKGNQYGRRKSEVEMCH